MFDAFENSSLSSSFVFDLQLFDVDMDFASRTREVAVAFVSFLERDLKR